MTTKDRVQGMLLGLAVGDALGVPVEFMSHEAVQRDPVMGMRGYGTHNQPPGTGSDDASLTFCLAEALIGGEANLLDRLATNMVNWVNKVLWTPHGRVFYIGITTSQAIHRLAEGTEPEMAGDWDEYANGNGSLMRILPLLLLILNKPIEERFNLVRRVSGVTHRHVRSVMACFYYLELARFIWKGAGKEDAYRMTNELVESFWHASSIVDTEQRLFERLLTGKLAELPETAIQSSGYVLHTLEASVWCWLTTDTYADAVLKAVNLGSDTDTTGAVTGGLAGLFYGVNALPTEWVNALAKRADIDKKLSDRLVLLLNKDGL